MDLQPDNVVEPALEAGLPGRCHTHVLKPWGEKTPSFCPTFPMSVLSLSWQKDRLGYAAGSKRPLFLNFSYVCPEPVLAKRSFLYINGFKTFSRLLEAAEFAQDLPQRRLILVGADALSRYI